MADEDEGAVQQRGPGGLFAPGNTMGFKPGESGNPKGRAHPTATSRQALRNMLVQNAEALSQTALWTLFGLFTKDPAKALAAYLRMIEVTEGPVPMEMPLPDNTRAVIAFNAPRQLDGDDLKMPDIGPDQPTKDDA